MLYSAIVVFCLLSPIIEYFYQIKGNIKWHSFLVLIIPIVSALLMHFNILDININIGPYVYNLNLLLPLFLINIACLLYMKHVCKKKITYEWLCLLAILINDLLSKIIFSQATINEFNYYNEFYTDTGEKVFFLLSYLIQEMSILFLFSNLYGSKSFSVFGKIIIIGCFVAISNIFAIIQSFLESVGFSGQFDNINTLLIFTIFMLFLLIMLFFIYLLNTRRERAKNKYIQIKNNLDDYYDKQMLLNQEELIKLKHDINNFLQVIKLSDEKMYDELIQKIGTSNKYNFTKDDTLNKIIVLKYNEAKNKGVEFDTEIEVPENIYIEETDKISLFCNIIDNAIEAARTSNDKYVHLDIYYRDKMLNIHINNSCDKIKRKTDSIYHGKGKTIVDEILEKYGGTLKSIYANGMYSLTIDCDILKTKDEQPI